MSEWVSVEERLPNKNDEYWVWPYPNDDLNIKTAVYQPWVKNWTQDFYNGYDYEECILKVTHWMPLPEPPKD